MQFSHILTGEARRFARDQPRFVRLRPRDGSAWELTARVSHVDVDHRATRAGRLLDYTLGVNWYVNQNVRIMGNLIYADLDQIGGSWLGGVRFGIDF